MTPQTQKRILSALDRILKALDNSEYESLLHSMQPILLHALIQSIPGVNDYFPGMGTFADFEMFLDRISTWAKLELLLAKDDEPSAENLAFILRALGELPSVAKQAFEQAGKRIRPVGGPKEQLSDPIEIGQITDEILKARPEFSETWLCVQERIAKQKDVSVKTVQRRFREEVKRRNALRTHDS